MPTAIERSAGVRIRVVAVALVALLALSPALVRATTLKTDIVDGVSAGKRGLDPATLPDVVMKEGALVDGDGRVLWARRPDVQRPMASITKIMTAVVALEHSSPSDVVTVPGEAVVVGQSSANLVRGERLTMQEMLEALLVKSGNDAAVAIAIHVGGTQAGFVDMMNQKAAELGLAGSHYANPHGLDAPGHYTTANDLSVLARYAMSKAVFRDIVGHKTVTIGQGKRRKRLTSTDLLLGNYQGAMGVKTGNTNGAGYSVVSAAQRDNITLYAIVMGTSSDLQRFQESKALLDWGFAHYRPTLLVARGTVVAEANVKDYLDVVVPAAVSIDASIPVLDVDGSITRTVSVADVAAPVARGERVGVATFRQAGRVLATVPIVSTQDVKKPNPLQAAWIAIVRVWRRIFGS